VVRPVRRGNPVEFGAAEIIVNAGQQPELFVRVEFQHAIQGHVRIAVQDVSKARVNQHTRGNRIVVAEPHGAVAFVGMRSPVMGLGRPSGVTY